MTESLKLNRELKPQKDKLAFKVEKPKEGVISYLFQGVAIKIGSPAGTTPREFPELNFETYDNDLGIYSINRPEKKNPAMNMDYISECIRKVSETIGIKRFWFEPYGADSKFYKNHQRRESARLELLKKNFPNIQPAPSGDGYILTL